MYENIRVNLFGIENTTLSSLPMIVGAACMMTSYTRLSYSVVVLMLETSNSFNLAVPMILAVFTTRTVADLFTNSLFDREVRNLDIPVLKGICPPQTANKKAYEVMSKTLISIPSIADMNSIKKALSSNHNAFPVLNTSGCLVGMLPKNILNILTNQKIFYETSRLSISSRGG